MKKPIFSIGCLILLLGITLSTKAQGWKALNGPVGTPILSSIITYENGNIYCLTPFGKVFMSSDDGVNWELIPKGLEVLKGKQLSIGKLKESAQNEIFLSTDNNLFKLDKSLKSWKTISMGIDIEDFDISPDGSKIYFGNLGALYISENGSAFNKVQNWGTHSVQLNCLGNNNNFVRRSSGSTGELWKFNDDGSNLRAVLYTGCCNNFFFQKSSNTIFHRNFNSELMYSKDFGTTWQNLPIAEPFKYDVSIKVELEDGSLISIGEEILRSQDGGINWEVDKEYALPTNNNFFSNVINRDESVSLSKDGKI